MLPHKWDNAMSSFVGQTSDWCAVNLVIWQPPKNPFRYSRVRVPRPADVVTGAAFFESECPGRRQPRNLSKHPLHQWTFALEGARRHGSTVPEGSSWLSYHRRPVPLQAVQRPLPLQVWHFSTYYPVLLWVHLGC